LHMLAVARRLWTILPDLIYPQLQISRIPQIWQKSHFSHAAGYLAVVNNITRPALLSCLPSSSLLIYFPSMIQFKHSFIIFWATMSTFPSITDWNRFIQLTKTVSIISIERPVKISSMTSYDSPSPSYSLCSSWVFSQPRRKSRMVQYHSHTVAATCIWIWKHPISLGLPLPCEPLHCPYQPKLRVCEFFGIWLHFLSEWTG
jgi:hypothetical protein